MRAEELDALYTALAEAIARVGESNAPLLLATLSLDLIAHHCRLLAHFCRKDIVAAR